MVRHIHFFCLSPWRALTTLARAVTFRALGGVLLYLVEALPADGVEQNETSKLQALREHLLALPETVGPLAPLRAAGAQLIVETGEAGDAALTAGAEPMAEEEEEEEEEEDAGAARGKSKRKKRASKKEQAAAAGEAATRAKRGGKRRSSRQGAAEPEPAVAPRKSRRLAAKPTQ